MLYFDRQETEELLLAIEQLKKPAPQFISLWIRLMEGKCSICDTYGVSLCPTHKQALKDLENRG